MTMTLPQFSYYFYGDLNSKIYFHPEAVILLPKYTFLKRKMTVNMAKNHQFSQNSSQTGLIFFLDIFRPYGDVVSARVYRPYSTLPNEITRWCPSVEVQDSFSAVVEYPTARCAKFAVGVLRERVQANRYRYLFEYVQKAVRQSVAIHRTGYPHDPGHMIIHNLGLFY